MAAPQHFCLVVVVVVTHDTVFVLVAPLACQFTHRFQFFIVFL